MNLQKYEKVWRILVEVYFGAVQKLVNRVDIVKSFLTSSYYSLAKIGFDTAENGPLKVHQKLAKS